MVLLLFDDYEVELSIEQLERIATQRIAISSLRHNSTRMTEATVLDVPPNGKIALTEQVGCMAVLGRTGLNATNERRTIQERAIEKGVRRL